MTRIFAALILALSMISFAPSIAAATLALGGYDPVTLIDGKPQKGVANFSTDWNGATWHFASAENRAKFTASPERYAPAYNGYCPVSLSEGKPAMGDITQAKMMDGKMYVMSSPEAKAMFERDPFKVIDRADPNWNKLREGLSQ
jgi:YHS domain-containing protein